MGGVSLWMGGSLWTASMSNVNVSVQITKQVWHFGEQGRSVQCLNVFGLLESA